MNFLNATEKDQIAAFMENPSLVNAIKKVLLSAVYYEGTLEADPTQNFLLALANRGVSEEQLGKNLKACAEGIKLVELGFKKLERLRKVVEPGENKVNKAR